jgi:simple sugar transport system permease protein
MLQVGEYNLVVEGGFMFAGAVVAWLASMVLPATAPAILSPALLILVGALVGAVCGMIPALLNIKWGSNVVVVTIMFNYILTYASTYILRYWMRDASVTYLGSQKFIKNAKLHSIISGTSMHTGLFIAIVAVILTWWFVNRTTKGFEIRVTGSNRKFAKYVGINAVGAMVLAQALGGALAGIGGAVEVLGKYDRFLWVSQTGYGFSGLMIAVLVQNRPELTPLIAFLFAYLQIGANLVGTTTDVPSEFVKVIQSIIILLVAAKLFMDSFRKRMVVKISTEEMEEK